MRTRTSLLHRRNRAGFTLIELIVTIVILGILAGLAVPAFNSVIDRSKTNAAYATLQAAHREAVALAAFDDGNVDRSHYETVFGTNTVAADAILAAGDLDGWTLTADGEKADQPKEVSVTFDATDAQLVTYTDDGTYVYTLASQTSTSTSEMQTSEAAPTAIDGSDAPQQTEVDFASELTAFAAAEEAYRADWAEYGWDHQVIDGGYHTPSVQMDGYFIYHTSYTSATTYCVYVEHSKSMDVWQVDETGVPTQGSCGMMW